MGTKLDRICRQDGVNGQVHVCCSGRPRTAKRLDVHVSPQRYCTNPITSKSRRPVLGFILMADFAQGLDASKMILAETVRFSNFCGYLWFTPANIPIWYDTHAHPYSCSLSSSPHTLPLRTTFPSFSLVYMYKRAKKQRLACSKWYVRLLSTDFHLY